MSEDDDLKITPCGIPEDSEYVEFDHMSVYEQSLHYHLEEKEKNQEYNKTLNELDGIMSELSGTLNELDGIMSQLFQLMTIKNNNANDISENNELLKIIINNIEKSQCEMVKQKDHLKHIEKVINESKKIEIDTGCNEMSENNKKICLNCNHTIYKKIKMCSHCKMAIYCNKKCQKRHWLIHKLDCKETKVDDDIL